MPRHDVVVTLTDPPLLLTLGPLLKLLKRARLVHWAQDLYPEVAEELGVLRKHGALAAMLRQASTFSLKRYDAVVAVGRCMEGRLRQRGLKRERVRVIPNWSLGQESDGEAAGATFRRVHGWTDRFVVMYSGNFGLAHPFAGVIDAIERTARLAPGILFVLVGEGAQRSAVEMRLRRAPNVQWLPHQPLPALAGCLRSADVHLASMYEETCGLVVPSKVYGIVAAGCPCVFLGPAESEGARVVRENGCGEVLPSGDGEGLARLLARWSQDPIWMKSMRGKARVLAPQLGLRPAAHAFAAVLGARELNA